MIGQFELFERDDVGVEGVRLDDVRAGVQVLPVDRPDEVRLRQAEDVVGVLEVDRMRGEQLAAVVLFRRSAPEDQRSHCSIEQQEAALEQVVEQVAGGLSVCIHREGCWF